MFNTIKSARAALRNQEISAMELTRQSLDQINQWEPHINAFNEVLPDTALTAAGEQDELIIANKAGPLSGLPISIKDVICTTEGHTTASSKILANFTSPYDATVVSRLKKAGAIIIGKANCDEFAMGGSNEYSSFGPVSNPWQIDKVSGGSSGGSIASVASGEVLGSLGTDTGGSIRLPASFCGVVGLKPTYGRVSRFGAIAYASSFDQIGPIGHTVADTAAIFTVIAGPDSNDATSAPNRVADYASHLGRDIKGLTIGIPGEYFDTAIQPEVAAAIKAALAELKKLGAKTVDISLPLTWAAIPAYYILVKAEASSNLARYDGLRYGQLDLSAEELIARYIEARGRYFGPEVIRSLLMGTYTLSAGYFDAWYKQAAKVRVKIRREFAAAFTQVDLIAGPVSAETAFAKGAKKDDPLAMYLADLLTVPASVAGLPAISVPAGFSQDHLPIGLQLIAPPFQEELLFQTAHAYEQSQTWWQEIPSLPSS